MRHRPIAGLVLLAVLAAGASCKEEPQRPQRPQWKGEDIVTVVRPVIELRRAERMEAIEPFFADHELGYLPIFWSIHMGGPRLRRDVIRRMQAEPDGGIAIVRAGLQSADGVSRFRAVEWVGQDAENPELLLEDLAKLARTVSETSGNQVSTVCFATLLDLGPDAAVPLANQVDGAAFMERCEGIFRDYGLEGIPALEALVARTDGDLSRRIEDMIWEIRASDGGLDPLRRSTSMSAGLGSDSTMPEAQSDSLAELGIARMSISEAREKLIAGLSDPDPLIRRKAASALSMLGPDAAPALPMLCDAIESAHDNQLRWYCLDAIAHIGPEAESATDLLAGVCTSHADPAARRRAAWALGEIGLPAARAVPALEALLNEPPDELFEVEPQWFRQATAAVALAKVAPFEAGAILAPHLGARDWRLRRTVADAMALAGSASAPALLRALNEDEPRARRSAARGLLKLGHDWPTALRLLAPFKGDKDAFVSWCARDAAARIEVAG